MKRHVAATLQGVLGFWAIEASRYAAATPGTEPGAGA